MRLGFWNADMSDCGGADEGPADVCATVVLDCHPVFTTMIILAGWLVKTAVANLVSGWVGMGLGGDGNTAGEMWLACSIP